MKPTLSSKKLWTAIVTALVTVLANQTGHPELAPVLAALGAALVVAIGMADWGKEARALEHRSVEAVRYLVSQAAELADELDTDVEVDE